jgi:hypothetical protein
VSLPFGKKNTPDQITLEAQASPLALLVKQSLVFVTPGDKRFDLIANGVASVATAPCPGCSSTAIQAHLDAPAFHALADNNGLTCEVFGFACALEPADTRALQDFARRIGL